MKLFAAAAFAAVLALAVADLRPAGTEVQVTSASGSFQIAQQQCPKGKRWDYQSQSCI